MHRASGNRQAVVLDGNYITTEIVQIVASGVTIADLTLRGAYHHPIHVMSTESSHTLNTLIYDVHIIDPGQQAIKINPVPGGFYTDDGVIACSHIELTDAGRPYIRDNCYTGGVDAHQARGWTVRDNRIEGFCLFMIFLWIALALCFMELRAFIIPSSPPLIGVGSTHLTELSTRY